MVVGEFAHQRDLIIIGGGPGGYSAAIRAAQLGLEVTIIEKNKLGGICLNQGCIPSKLFAHAAEKASEWDHLEELGFEANTHSFHLANLQAFQEKVMENLRKGVEQLCKANQVEVIEGTASFISEQRIGVENGDHFELYEFEKAIIATGGRPNLPEGIEAGERILTAKQIYHVSEIPSHLIIYGSDYIAIEAAFSFKQLGADITLVLENQLADFQFDPSINKELTRLLKKQKIKVVKKASLNKSIETEENVQLEITKGNGESVVVEGSHLFVSLGVTPNVDEGTDTLNLEKTESGYLVVNEHAQTSQKNVYAVGDVTQGPALAVKAIKQGKVAAEHCAGKASSFNLLNIPTVIHSNPPVGTVGLTEDEARAEGYNVSVGEFPMMSNGFATITGKSAGTVKVISDQESDLILGIHMLGHGAVELIQSGTLALEMGARDEDLLYPFYPHPNTGEGLLEAVESIKGNAIHVPPKKQSKKAVKA